MRCLETALEGGASLYDSAKEKYNFLFISDM